MITDKELKAVEAEYSAAARVLDEIAVRRTAARQEMAMQKDGLKPGDRVMYKGYEYAVQGFDVKYGFDDPWLLGYKVLKSGAISTNCTTLYDEWTKL